MKVFRRGTDGKLPIHPLIFVAGLLLVGILFGLQEWVGIRHTNLKWKISFSLLMSAWIVQYLIWALLCLGIWRALGRWLQSVGVFWMIAGVLPISIAASVIEELLWVPCFPSLPISDNYMNYWQRLAFHLRAEVVDGVFLFWCVFFLFRGLDYYQRFREKEASAAQLEVQLARAQLRALRSHLNPHFLFNTLNSISSLMQTDVAGADKMLEQFSQLLRITLDRGDVQLIRLSDEMEFVEMYMGMQDRRFGGRVHREVRVQPELHDALVPAMILQPIVENAYEHGLSRLEGEGKLLIEAERKGSRIRIRVVNSGIGLVEPSPDDDEAHGFGLANVTERLRLHYHDAHAFSMREISPGNVQVSMTVPFQVRSDLNEKPNPIR